jgi:hypothetical protein
LQRRRCRTINRVRQVKYPCLVIPMAAQITRCDAIASVSDRAIARSNHVEDLTDFKRQRLDQFLNEEVGIELAQARESPQHRWRCWFACRTGSSRAGRRGRRSECARWRYLRRRIHTENGTAPIGGERAHEILPNMRGRAINFRQCSSSRSANGTTTRILRPARRRSRPFLARRERVCRR